MATGNRRATDRPPEVDDWLDGLDRLVDDLKTWAEADGWETRLTGRNISEAGGVRYKVPALVLDRGDSEIALVPVTRQVPGADGLVDLYLMPDFDSMASLYWQAGQWFCHYAFRSDLTATRSVIEAARFPLDGANLRRVLNDIATHA